MIEGISHLTFVVKNLERASAFFRVIFGAEEVYSSGDENLSTAKERFLLVGGIWIAIMEGDPLPDRTYNHVAFKVSEAELDAYESRARSMRVKILPARPRVKGEGRSLYFYDYDNHLFELHTGTLAERLARYAE